MSPEAQRIAIAEACGWTRLNQGRGYGRPPNSETDFKIPDYLSDLNAIHDAEETLSDELREVFAWHLFCGKFDWYRMRLENGEPYSIGYLEEPAKDAFRTYHATAAERAEAFLRTIGKLDDTK